MPPPINLTDPRSVRRVFEALQERDLVRLAWNDARSVCLVEVYAPAINLWVGAGRVHRAGARLLGLDATMANAVRLHFGAAEQVLQVEIEEAA